LVSRVGSVVGTCGNAENSADHYRDFPKEKR
jgi:hypothetical protein